MLNRFASAAAVAAIVIAFLALVVLILAGLGQSLQQFSLIIVLWCLVPALWGFWAMLTPRAWFPARLPWWGAILGCILVVFGALVLNLPLRVFGVDLPVVYRVVVGVIPVVIYYLLWIGVRTVYLRLTHAA